MTGFIPAGYQTLLDAVKEYGLEFLGPRLAAGSLPLRIMNERTGQITGVVRSGRLFRLAGAGELVQSGRLRGDLLLLEKRHIVQERHAVQRPHVALNAAISKNAGGAPVKYDYEGGLIELARLAYVGEAKSEDELVRGLTDWMAAKYKNGGPDPREIRKRVRRFYKEVFEGE